MGVVAENCAEGKGGLIVVEACGAKLRVDVGCGALEVLGHFSYGLLESQFSRPKEPSF